MILIVFVILKNWENSNLKFICFQCLELLIFLGRKIIFTVQTSACNNIWKKTYIYIYIYIYMVFNNIDKFGRYFIAIFLRMYLISYYFLSQHSALQYSTSFSKIKNENKNVWLFSNKYYWSNYIYIYIWGRRNE